MTTKLTIVMVCGTILTLLLAYGAYFMYDAGKTKTAAEQAVADQKAELERKGDDATLQRLSDYDLCVRGMRANKLPINACDELRGDGQE